MVSKKELRLMGASVTPSEDTSKCSEMKRMEAGDDEGGGGLRTLECLRGRLLAQRQASRVAKEEAELMENKLMELENKLKEETKFRKRAEKKLKLLMRKLEALKICVTFEGLELSSSSENGSSWASSSSSLTSVSCPKKDHEECDSKSQKAISCPLHRPKDHCSLGDCSHGSNSIAQGSNACEYDLSFPNAEATDSKAHQKGKTNGSDSEDGLNGEFIGLGPRGYAPPTIKASDEVLIPTGTGEALDIF